MIPFREHESKKRDEKNVFDDSYKYTPNNDEWKQKKFEKNYIKGNLKSSIIFDDQYVK
jgi:N-acetylneuraminic acid mutarotase